MSPSATAAGAMDELGPQRRFLEKHSGGLSRVAFLARFTGDQQINVDEIDTREPMQFI